MQRSLLTSLVAAAIPGFALAAPALARPAQETDTVQLKGGTAEEGEIQSEDWAGITIKAKGGTKVIAWSDVESETYADAPADLDAAVSETSGGQLDSAQAKLSALAGDKELRPVIRQKVQYLLAWVEQRTGDPDAALTGFRGVVEAFPTGRYLRSASESVVSALAGKGDLAGALDFVTRASEAAKDPGPQAELSLLRGRVLELQKKPADARAVYEAAEKAADVPPSVAQEAKLGRARCLLLEGKAAEAEPIFRELTAPAEAPRVLAGAFNGLGDLQSEAGRSKRDPNQIVEAAYSYLRGVVQYRPQVGDPSIEHERSLAGAARCFRYISELEQNADRKRKYQDRSQAKLDELRRDYPLSAFLEEK